MNKNIEYVNRLLIEAVKSRASDIHFDPAEGGGGRVRLRIDGVLHDAEPPEGKTFGEVVNRIKIMADLDIAERRMPQDGRIMLKLQGKPYDLRVCAVPTLFGERVVLRILHRDAVVLDLDRLGLGGDDLAKVRKLCNLPNGIVICTGPTGCGKTTLLYAMLNQIDRDKECVMTVEDPVEYSFAGMGQIQVDPRRGLTFARAIRSILRQDPDVIMVGEIRDMETAQICAQVALTGHLVMTTLHAETAPGAIKRLLDMGMEPFLVNACLASAVSQRLVRMLCAKCKQPSRPAKHSMPPEAAEFVAGHKGAEFFGPKGCDECKGTGYRGRTAIHEILIMDDRIRQLVADKVSVSTLRDAAVQGGMKTLLMDGLEKAARGITSVEEVLRVVPH